MSAARTRKILFRICEHLTITALGLALLTYRYAPLISPNTQLTTVGEERMGTLYNEDVPGWEGTIGPFPSQYGKPHVYARDINSGAGNCVCGNTLGSARHVQAAPGVDVPEEFRTRPTGPAQGEDRTR